MGQKKGSAKKNKPTKSHRTKSKSHKAKGKNKTWKSEMIRVDEVENAEQTKSTADWLEGVFEKQMRAKLTEEDAFAMAEALMEMANDGADNPIAFFVSGDDPLGRKLIQLQGGDLEERKGLVPVVLDSAQVRRYAMLTIADELIWRQEQKDPPLR